MEEVATTRGMRCPSRHCLSTTFDYKNHNFNFGMLNCDDFCRLSKPKPTDKHPNWVHCLPPDAKRKEARVLIMVNVIKYLTKCGIFVIYFNCGGDGTKSMMRDVWKGLSSKDRLLCRIDPIGIQHAYRLVDGPRVEAKRVKRAEAVSSRVRDWSIYYSASIHSLNLFRGCLGLLPRELSVSLYDGLAADFSGSFVVDDDSPSSLDRKIEESAYQKNGDTALLAMAVHGKSEKGDSALSVFNPQEWQGKVDKATCNMDDSDKARFEYFLSHQKEAALIVRSHRGKRRCQEEVCNKWASTVGNTNL